MIYNEDQQKTKNGDKIKIMGTYEYNEPKSIVINVCKRKTDHFKEDKEI